MREHGEEHTCTKEEYYYEQLCYVLQQLPWPANKHAPLSLSLTHTDREEKEKIPKQNSGYYNIKSFLLFSTFDSWLKFIQAL
jgi:hypothetical protein